MKTFILGDIHGEYDKCLEILKYVNIIDDAGRWKNGLEARLIQVGDVIDRGDESVKSFKLLRDLQMQAVENGGKVIRLLGNHELSYIGGAMISNRPEGFLLAELIKMDILEKKVQAAYLLDDWIVVHAGITKRLSEDREPEDLVDDFNDRLVSAVNNGDFSDEIFLVGSSRGGRDEPGIFWADYDWDLLPEEDALPKQIVGHSPRYKAKPEIKMSPKGNIIDVDIGMSDRCGGNKGILLYEDGEFNSIIL